MTSKTTCVTLEDAVEALIDYRGKTPKKTLSGVPLITAKVIKNGEILEPNEFIAPENYDSWMVRGLPKAGDVVLTVEAPLGQVAQLEDSYVALAQRVVTLRGKKGVLDNTYLKYLLMSSPMQSALDGRSSGSTVKGIKQSELRKLELELPDINVQEKIATILGSLDGKIAINKSMNQTLEKIAQRIFKSWFIDFDPVKANKEGVAFDGLSPEIQALFPSEFEESELGMIPKGWEVKPFSAIARLETKSVKPGSMPDKTWVHFSIPAFDESRFPTLDLGETIKSNKYKMYPNTVLVSKLNPRFKRIWFPNIVASDDSSICSTEFMQFVPNNDDWYSYLISYVISNRFQSEMLKTVSGTTGSRQRAQPKEVAVMQSLIPSNAIVEKYSGIILPIVRRHQDNHCQIQTLKQLRDRLLPKLISGQITVGEAQKELAEAI
ncbi:TPA: restriction endonuclease subunit S [Vibrio vulnificus]|uniref:restriction endonuclease subunit S n=1 Tax=Vibrio parahaemolyticus TaxID=670 RepID=UPI002358E831|nr:restriction endonuclease subunit S [Vibrio parahaemolyticus]WCY99808.1 restriction endonuclease subunit S [Vibrio parahaemolyticus]HDY7678739.1 restriction endonuclease subunit S [Vibrio vulnificus]